MNSGRRSHVSGGRPILPPSQKKEEQNALLVGRSVAWLDLNDEKLLEQLSRSLRKSSLGESKRGIQNPESLEGHHHNEGSKENHTDV